MRVSVAGGELNVDVRGAGPALLFLHAFPLRLEMWDAQATALAATHKVIRFDARGFGDSPAGTSPLTMEQYADDAIAVLEHLGETRAVGVGLSMGGYAGLALVRRHPGKLAGLVLADTRAGADSEEGKKNRTLLADKVRTLGAVAAIEAFLPKLVGETSKKSRPAVLGWVEKTIAATSPAGIANALLGMAARADSTPTLAQIRVPTLVLCGEEDVLTPPSESESLQRAIPGAELVRIPKAGHLACLENPEAFTAPLRQFLATVAGRA